jgi:DNA modification methylase
MSYNRIDLGNAEDLIPTLPDSSVGLTFTSPPYALQRKKQYGGVSEADYPAWFTDRIMRPLMPKMRPDGNVLINIKGHVREGQVSDYVYRLILAIRDAGWIQPDEIIWHSPDKPPLGRTKDRPRRTWEHLLWFSPSRRPFIDVRACSTGDANWAAGRSRKKNHLVNGKQVFKFKGEKQRARITDIVTASIGGITKNVPHPAMFPAALPEFIIKTFSRPMDVVVDPFVGSGTTVLAAQNLGRRYWGCDRSAEYVILARRRLLDLLDARRAG